MKMSSDTSYIFQSMYEELQLTPEVPIAIELMNLDVDYIHDNGNIYRDIEINFQKWYKEESSDIEKSFLAYYFITESSFQLKEIKLHLVNILKNHYLSKNEEESSFVFLSVDDELEEQKELIIKSNSIKEIFLIKNHELLFDNFIINYLNKYIVKYNLFTSNIKHTFEESMRWFYETHRKVDSDIIFNMEPLNIIESQSIVSKTSKKEDKKVKRIFNKSLDVLNKFLGVSKSKSFISGDGFKLEGNLYNYKLKKLHNCLLEATKNINNNSIQYSLELYSKDNNFLSNLCVTFPGSPILDQVLSVYLMIEANQEEELLKSSNFYNRKEEFLYKDEYLSNLKGFNSKVISDDNTNVNVFFKKSKKETFFDSKKLLLNQKIERNLFNGEKIPKKIIQELFNQELSFDQKMDYISIGIPMPEHMDFLIKRNKKTIA